MRGLFAVLVLGLLGAACGGGSAANGPSPNAAKRCSSPGRHHADVEVVDGGRIIASGCAGFDSASLDGISVMKHSGVEFATQKFSFGTAVCQVDRIPAAYSQCLPQNAPYWALWTWNGSAWSMAQTGPEQVQVSDREALGWVYTPQTASPAPPPAPPAG